MTSTAAFSQGRLSYSKVREMTRVADRVDETALVDLACAMTASQLARTLSSSPARRRPGAETPPALIDLVILW